MTDIALFNPATMPPPVGFSRAAASDGLLWVSGHLARDEHGAIVAPKDIVGQFAQTLRNMGSSLSAAGCTPADILMITYFVTDVAAYRDSAAEIAAVAGAFLGAHLPASTMVGVTELITPDALVEIQCVARHASSTHSGD